MYSEVIKLLKTLLDEYEIAFEVTDVAEQVLLKLANVTCLPKRCYLYPSRSSAFMFFCYDYGLYGMPEKAREQVLQYIQEQLKDDTSEYYFDADLNLHCFRIQCPNFANVYLPLLSDYLEQANLKGLLKPYQSKSLQFGYYKVKSLIKKFETDIQEIKCILKSYNLTLKFVKGYQSALDCLLETMQQDSNAKPSTELAWIGRSYLYLENLITENQTEFSETHLTKLSELLASINPTSFDDLLQPQFCWDDYNPNTKRPLEMCKAHAKMASINRYYLNKENLTIPSNLQALIASFMFNKKVSQFGKNACVVYPKGQTEKEIREQETLEIQFFKELQEHSPNNIYNLWGLFGLSNTHQKFLDHLKKREIPEKLEPKLIQLTML